MLTDSFVNVTVDEKNSYTVFTFVWVFCFITVLLKCIHIYRRVGVCATQCGFMNLSLLKWTVFVSLSCPHEGTMGLFCSVLFCSLSFDSSHDKHAGHALLWPMGGDKSSFEVCVSFASCEPADRLLYTVLERQRAVRTGWLSDCQQNNLTEPCISWSNYSAICHATIAFSFTFIYY